MGKEKKFRTGYIQGFGTQPPKFDQFQAHGIEAKDERKTYDIAIYNIVKFFQLAMENNPNMVEILFLPPRCLLSTSQIYDRMRQSRKAFLHKGAYHKFLGYAHSQLKKLDAESRTNPRRQSDVELYGFGGNRTEGANGRWISSIAQRKCLSSRAFFRFFLHSERLSRPLYSKVHQTPAGLVQVPDSDR